MFEYYFSDMWWLWVWKNFSISLLIGLGILKIVAIIWPGTKTTQILDLLQDLLSWIRPTAKDK